MRYWDDIELPDEDELARDDLAEPHRNTDAAPQPHLERDEEWVLVVCQTRKKGTHLCALLLRLLRLCS